MKKVIFFIFCSLFLSAFKLISQEKLAIINLSTIRESASDNSYYQVFKLSNAYNSKQIEEFKAQSFKYKYVTDVTVNKVVDGYDVKLLLNKEAEDTPYYFRDYLLSLSIDHVIVDGNKIKTMDYYTCMTQKVMHKEIPNKN
ncbi:MAG: hypothetical protein HY062_02145 [Bacteroidetes bacterium]|nr:hypothetical protein [Bacteroidota bacterium]